ncbi:lipid IV(A) 4-amino-4-deoxy-L-arabinosyltransferase [Edwardsiella piscicida]|uniref:lipid IV(A) 4-amino-4-deoxy-L-arabinosyltransferase n=1 Tax=Edwardsiella piscicida TaxID=1263550 RepID=UPI0002C0774F|nr:lipid IV(A) 4-amino-4-deoxy-L-arabinosyltransferase [Edwardsiella piscicida]AGH73353.1 4-amino-4-deoxy-L-arabinose transferase [Edwardsiella piscicida C07-087]EKS7779039.1 lipid IV(A) 4-amino-4-deoxy-L-arabinosyltransferase [Edwardsiella piscicida]EKS7782459.1 lipid IV(A) 4-amino-4-deoxy-L-arabinosyltransferase [Edwardsiella piscicida]EKS7811956.1 lipid IV(A) 4-amino-4-deoxy-L-arabinosyltransferase [Edwardsiella piscicida]UCQ22272.1 lipid IV(A) 4-amino-4-deoxy-L-arabinosyltransferase [Edwar
MKKIAGWVTLAVLFVLYYIVPLPGRLLWQPDETRYAEISREMLASGDWIVPHFLGLRYFEKPVAGYWVNNLGQWLFGDGNFAVRFGAVLATVLSALLVFWLARRLLSGTRPAVLAALIYLTSFLVYGVGSYAVLDPIFTLWMTAAMCSFWLGEQASSTRGRVGGYILLGLACGMGFMTKGFLALAIPVIAVLPWVIAQRRWKSLFCFGPLAVLSAILISLPWVLAIAQREPDYWRYFFWVEHIQRFAEDNAQHKAPFWYYLPILLLGLLPWLGLLPGALREGWRGRVSQGGDFYLLGWAVMPFLLFSIAKGKLPTYILPCFAPLAILMAGYVQRLAGEGGKALRINGVINLLVGLGGMAAILLVLAPWGIIGRPLFGAQEVSKVILGTVAFGVWALFGALSLHNPRRYWRWSAACPLGIALLIGAALPQQVMESKQPQTLIQAAMPQLQASRYILSDSVGVAAGLAWELKRSDIYLYDNTGELQYGLSYPDAAGHLVNAAQFPVWLAEHRKQGAVSLVLLLSRNEQVSSALPPADMTLRKGRFLLLQYQQQP